MKNDFVWGSFHSGLFSEWRGVLPFKQLGPEWRPMVKQANGCSANARARLAAKVGEVEATYFLENEGGEEIPKEVIEVGLLQKARFSHMG